MNNQNATNTNNVLIKLTHPEALVLLELVSRLNHLESGREFKILDQAEQRILWNIESILEKSLPDVFAENYTNIIKEARAKVKDKVD